MDKFTKEVKDSFISAMGSSPKFLEMSEDIGAEARFNSLSDEDRRKLLVGVALCQVQLPDELRFELLNNHLDEAADLVHSAMSDINAQFIALASRTGDQATQAAVGSVRLAAMMNLLGFDRQTLEGVLNDQSLTRKAGLIVMEHFNDMGQKIQQLFDEKQK